MLGMTGNTITIRHGDLGDRIVLVLLRHDNADVTAFLLVVINAC